MAESFGGSEFIREIEVETQGIILKIHQFSVGDVGCVVWDAGIVLSKYLDYKHKNDNFISKKSVIDIGSGTGIVGLFAAALGADVILTDLPVIQPLLEKNIESNKDVLNGNITSAILSWGEDAHKFSSPDIILVSDCIYYDRSVDTLIPTVVTLASEKTDIYISYEDRDLGNKRELLKAFLIELKKSFHVHVIPSNEQHPDFQSPDIHLLRCRIKNKQIGG